MTRKRPTTGDDLLRLKDSPRRDDLRKADRPVDRLLALFR
jgi:hypothetical protein